MLTARGMLELPAKPIAVQLGSEFTLSKSSQLLERPLQSVIGKQASPLGGPYTHQMCKHMEVL